MYTHFRIAGWVSPVRTALALFLVIYVGQAPAAPTAANPCGQGAVCFQSFELPGHAGLMHYYTSALPETPPQPHQALVILHGHPRDANLSFAAGTVAAHSAGRQEDTLIIAPLFQVAADQAAHCNTAGLPEALPSDATWSCASWLEGGLSTGPHGISAFAALDALVAELKQQWPTLDTVTVAGFSAGAQILQRQIAFAAKPPLGVHLRYVVADPGSWLYFDPVRPRLQSAENATLWSDCSTTPLQPGRCSLQFEVPTASACPQSNVWKYGLEQLPAHLAPESAAARARYIDAEIHYLEGELDSSARKGTFYPILDKSCGALAQGPFRLQRGIAYAAYDRQYLTKDGHHALTIVPGCAHSVSCVFNADAARSILFPPPGR